MENHDVTDESGVQIETGHYEVVGSWPHDPKAFTEGLEFFDGYLYESTGGDKGTPDIGLSSLRKVNLRSGEVLQKLDLDKEHFAEGLTIFGDKIFQLTYRSKKVLVYDLKKFTPVAELPYDAGIEEGWGLSHDDRHLIMSDGTDQIRFLDPVNLKILRTKSVKVGRKPLSDLNELEYVNGQIYANVLGEDYIARLDRHTGNVLGWIDLTKLRPRNSKVLNGIAYDKSNGHIFVTGKQWPTLYELRLR